MACGLVSPKSPATSFTGITVLHWRVIVLRGEVANQTMRLTASSVAACLEMKVMCMRESGTTYGAPWKRANWTNDAATFSILRLP